MSVFPGFAIVPVIFNVLRFLSFSRLESVEEGSRLQCTCLTRPCYSHFSSACLRKIGPHLAVPQYASRRIVSRKNCCCIRVLACRNFFYGVIITRMIIVNSAIVVFTMYLYSDHVLAMCVMFGHICPPGRSSGHSVQNGILVFRRVFSCLCY